MAELIIKNNDLELDISTTVNNEFLLSLFTECLYEDAYNKPVSGNVEILLDQENALELMMYLYKTLVKNEKEK